MGSRVPSDSVVIQRYRNRPFIAFPKFKSDDLMATINRLNLINSCFKTVFMDSPYDIGNFFATFSSSKTVGIFSRTSDAIFAT